MVLVNFKISPAFLTPTACFAPKRMSEVWGQTMLKHFWDFSLEFVFKGGGECRIEHYFVRIVAGLLVNLYQRSFADTITKPRVSRTFY